MISRAPLLCSMILLAGCGSYAINLPVNETAESQASQSSRFNPSQTGDVTGTITWTGMLPQVPPISYQVPRQDGAGLETRTAHNPNEPRIDAATRALTHAVVYLRGIDPTTAAPRRLPPVTVEIGSDGIHIQQGQERGRTGFVRQGDVVSFSSNEPTFHIIRARGDDFFSLTFPTPGSPVERTLKKKGRIELSSGTGLSWMRADLFVCDHPYYTLTDHAGQFSFREVPEGQAELVVWLPNWNAGQLIREPESTIIARQTYQPPFEKVTSLTIASKKTTVFTISLP